jgi:hypothetical protein
VFDTVKEPFHEITLTVDPLAEGEGLFAIGFFHTLISQTKDIHRTGIEGG